MPYPYDENSPEIVNATRGRTVGGVRTVEPAFPTQLDRAAAAAEWNAAEEGGVRQVAQRAFIAEAVARIAAVRPEFGTLEDVQRLKAMAVMGMLSAPAGWNADGRLLRDIVLYVEDEALPRVRGTGGHPQLTVAQLQTVAVQIADALPFAGVDATDTGWPT